MTIGNALHRIAGGNPDAYVIEGRPGIREIDRILPLRVLEGVFFARLEKIGSQQQPLSGGRGVTR